MFGLATVAVELPFLATCLVVQCFRHCDHCRHVWPSWPILSGVGPWYIGTVLLWPLSRNLSMLSIRWGWAVFTLCFITVAFAACWRSTLWRQLLATTLILSSALALLAFGIIAA